MTATKGNSATGKRKPADAKARFSEAPREPLVDFLEKLDLDGLDLTREPDYGRDVAV